MKARKTKHQNDWKEYHKQTNDYKKLLTKNKKDSWRTFCGNVESTDERSRMTKILKNNQSKHTTHDKVYREDQTLTNNPKETLEQMAKVHFHTDRPIDRQTHTNPNNNHSHNNKQTNTTNIFNLDRMTRAMRESSPYKAPGPDGIQPILLQKGWDDLCEPIQHIMIASHKLGQVPDPWAESTSIFTPKPGKTDYRHPSSYRTITLTSVLLKLQERITLWYMQHDLKLDTLINKRQYGFK